MKFILFNIFLMCISYAMDYVAIDLFSLVKWSNSYIYYFFIINLPISLLMSNMLMNKIKYYLE